MQSTEHKIVGDAIRIPDPHAAGVSFLSNGTPLITLTPESGQPFELSYGTLVALGGDFYGTPTLTPISSEQSGQAQQDAFQLAFSTLLNSDSTERERILHILVDVEEAAVAPNGVPVADPAAAFATLGRTCDYAWNVATGGGSGPLGMMTDPGRYADLAMANLDHFGDDAAAAYTAGHNLACQIAPSDLALAIAMNAHADHFLTDLFASGHIRTPRRLSDTTSWNGPYPQKIGAVVALAMHDEENKTGLTVQSTALPTPWVAVGDGHILCPNHTNHFDAAVQAVQASIEEVLSSDGGTPALAALLHRPVVTPMGYPPSGGPSIAPMLVSSGSYDEPPIKMRYDPNSWHIDYPVGPQTVYDYTTSFSWVDILGANFKDFFWPGS